ncbi:MAG: O-antigen ligase family protein [Planctomycetes bacterium]|nr:O-antigen ligase family protein [Planctomycetota bacterium]
MQHSPFSSAHSEDQGPAWVWWSSVFVLAAVFLSTEHSRDASVLEAFTLTQDEMEVGTEGGNAQRRAAFLALAAFAFVLLTLPARRRLRFDTLPAVALVLYVGWCGLSTAWADDPEMSVRRVVVFYCVAIAALAIARQLSLRQLMSAAAVLSTLFLLYGIAAELAQGTLRPWSGEYRFAGTQHPNTQGLNLAVLCLSTFCLARGERRRWILLWGLFSMGLAFLVLTKSRTALAGLVVALTAIWTVRTPARAKSGYVAAAVWLLAAGALAGVIAGADLERQAGKWLLLGRDEQASSLSGRLPIWTELVTWIEDRPLAGYGYDSFWTAERIDSVSSEVEWPVREAHSSYIELVLSVGLIGAVLLISAVIAGLRRAAAAFAATARIEHGFVLGLLALGLVDGLTESAMTFPMYMPFVAACGLAGTVLCRPVAFAVRPVELGAPAGLEFSRS